MENAKKLLIDVRKKLQYKEDMRTETLKGVKNLSVSDLLTLELYAKTIISHGRYKGILMRPLGYVGQVMDKYGLLEDDIW